MEPDKKFDEIVQSDPVYMQHELLTVLDLLMDVYDRHVLQSKFSFRCTVYNEARVTTAISALGDAIGEAYQAVGAVDV